MKSFIAIISILGTVLISTEEYSLKGVVNNVVISENHNYINNDLCSTNLEYTDFGGINTDVYFISTKENEKINNKLVFISDIDEYQYCKIESIYGNLENNEIKKNQSTLYSIDLHQDNNLDYIDKLTLKYYNDVGKLLEFKEKFIYWDEVNKSYYTLN